MPSPRRPLPPVLQGAAFTVAQGRSLGLGETRLRGSDLKRPFHGIRIGVSPEVGGLPFDDLGRAGSGDRAAGPGKDSPWCALVDRCDALLTALPSSAFVSHLTAARLWPLPLPLTAADEPVHVCVRPPDRPPRRTGVDGHLVRDPLVRVVRWAGLPLVDLASLFCQVAGQLSLPDLVAIGDALVLRPVYSRDRDDRPWLTMRQLQERVELFHGRGKLAATSAVRLIRPGAESRPETLLRLAILDAGLPEPEVNVELRAGGRFLGRADLVYRQWRVIVEYDGDQHRTSTRQFDHDVVRLEGFARAGWTVVRVVGRSFWADRQGCVSRVRIALIEAGWRG